MRAIENLWHAKEFESYLSSLNAFRGGSRMRISHFALFLFLLAAGSTAGQRPIKGLDAPGPDPALADKLNLFGQFVGDWEFDMTMIQPDGSRVTGKGEWHFGWVLQGRAIEDAWIAWDDSSKPNATPSEYGATVRCYDVKTDTWRVVWVGPLRRNLITFVGRKIGDEIVMEADTRDASPQRSRWIFSNITASSFDWRAVRSTDGGKTWVLQQELSVRRLK